MDEFMVIPLYDSISLFKREDATSASLSRYKVVMLGHALCF